MLVGSNLRKFLKTSQDKPLTLQSQPNGQQTQQNTEEICNTEILTRNCTSHIKHETTANVDIKVQESEICINVSGCSVAQFGSDTKALEVQSGAVSEP